MLQDFRVAVVGSGPAGIYAAAALAGHEGAAVDVIDRLPTPFGLVRYGVAPDHEKMKSVAVVLRKVLEHERLRFLGNVELGADVSVADLHRHYDAIVVANGAAVDRRLGIGGEDLPGSFSATEFVSWYSGHPDTALDKFTLTAQTAIVIGVGNVAVDVARVLLKTADELKTTDIPDHVLAVLSRSSVRDVMIIGQRGPAYARFTTKELRELGELANADVVVAPAELALDEAGEAELARNAVARRNLEVLQNLVPASAAGPAQAVAPALPASPDGHLRRCARHWHAVRARAPRRCRRGGRRWAVRAPADRHGAALGRLPGRADSGPTLR